jgi:phosphoenolpyruvate carboxykinase (ATP)
MVNTGWTGGPYGTGTRMSLKYTRALITAALEGKLDNVDYENHEIFGLAVPLTCPGVPDGLLNPRDTWDDKDAYDHKAQYLAEAFLKNFEKFAALANADILAGAPKLKADA